MSFWIGDACYFPELGDVMPDGWLRVPTCGQSEAGERWDGSALIGPDFEHYFEHYKAWKEIVESKEQLRRQREEDRKRAREERRRFYKLVLGESE